MNKTFQTTDLYIAAAVAHLHGDKPHFKTKGFGLVSFSFPSSEEILEIAEAYSKGILEINAQGFSSTLKKTRYDMLQYRNAVMDKALEDTEFDKQGGRHEFSNCPRKGGTDDE